MIYYKHNETGAVYAYSDDQINHPFVVESIKKMTLMTDDEIHAHLNPPETAEAARSKRDSMLLELDQVVSNPLRWQSMTPELQDEISNYRKLLLDVPQQAGFPENIEWPSPPEGL